MKSTRFTFLSLCVTVLLAVLLAACGTQNQPAATSELPSNFGEADVMLPGFDKPQKVTYEIVDGYAIFEGDIILGQVDKYGNLSKSDLATQGVAIDGQNFRWPDNVVPFVITGNWGTNDAAMRANITGAVSEWNTKTNLRLVARTNETAFINFVVGMGCSSFIGRQGNGQTIDLAANCSKSAVIHEIGHAVGLFHEQSREARDSFVTILCQNIVGGCGGLTDTRNFSRHVNNATDIGPYNFNSIMHYSCTAFSANGLPTISLKNPPAGVSCATVGRGTGLNAGDISAVRALYPTAKQIAVGRNQDGRLEVFYVGTNDRNYHNWQRPSGGGWAGESALGGWAKQITVAANLDGRLEVFYVGTDDRIYHNRQWTPNGSWVGEALL